jgi:transposase, IS30 family
MGDWGERSEGLDTVIGKNHKDGLVILAERKYRYVLAVRIRSKHAAAVTTRLLRPHQENGKEFAEHELMAADMRADIYFAYPYSSWERELNENSGSISLRTWV